MKDETMNDIKTPERMAIVEKVAELGPLFAKRADAIDANAEFPYENWADLRAAGLLGIVIPKSHGGLGGDFVAYALASEELAKHCASTALTFNMHVATTLLVGEVAGSLGLEGDALGVLIIQSAMPPAVFCAVVALEFDMEPDRTTRTVLGTTLLSLITIPFALLTVT